MPTISCPHCSKAFENSNVVTRETFDARIKELSDAKTVAIKDADEAKQAAGVATKIATKYEELKARHEKTVAGHTKAIAFSDKGIKDAEVRDLFGSYFDRQAESGEKDIGKWLEGLTAEGAEVPMVLKPFIPTAAGKEKNGTSWALPADSGGKGPASNKDPFNADWVDQASDADFKRSLAALAEANPELGIDPSALPWDQQTSNE